MAESANRLLDLFGRCGNGHSRGDELCALSPVIGAEHTYLDPHAVVVVRNGLILELITFDDAQLEETLDELDRQWVELGRSSENP